MTNSLKEEILYGENMYDHNGIPNKELFVDRILSRIEKRIDEQLTHPEDRCNCNYHDGVVYALNWMKEMLK